MSDESSRIIMGWDVLEEPAAEPLTPEELAAELPGLTPPWSLLQATIRAARKIAEERAGVAIGLQTVRMTLSRFPLKSDGDGLVFVLLSWPVGAITRFDYRDARGTKRSIKEGGYHLDRSVRPARVQPLATDEYWPLAARATDAVTLEYVTGAPATPEIKLAVTLIAAYLAGQAAHIPAASGRDEPFPIPLAASGILRGI